MERPGSKSTTSSVSCKRRHICPRPETKYQISSTVWWAMAFETARDGSVKCAKLPRPVLLKMRTSEPSGAIASGDLPSRLVTNDIKDPHNPCCLISCDHPNQASGALTPYSVEKRTPSSKLIGM